MSSNNSSNRLNVPEAKQAMDQFKMQSANEVASTSSRATTAT